MNRLDKAAKQRMIAGLAGIEGHCTGLGALRMSRIMTACDDGELRTWSDMAKELGRRLIDLSASLTRGGSGIIEDQAATDAARYLGAKGGAKGGRKGGSARMNALSPEERRELGRNAAATRWGKPKKGP